MTTLTLDRLPCGCRAAVDTLRTQGAMRRRLLDLGLTPGTEVEALFRSAFGELCAYRIRGTVIALRGEDAATVQLHI